MPPTHCSYETHGHDGAEHQPAVADVPTRLEEYQQSSSIISSSVPPSKIPASQSQPVPISQPVDPSKMQPLMVQTGTPPGFFTWVPGYFFQQPPFNQQFPNVNAQTFQPSTGNPSPATTASSSPVHFENQEVAKTEISENAASPAQFSQAAYPNPIPVPLSAPAGVMMYGPPDVPAFSSSYSSPSQSYPPSQYASPAGYAPDMYQGAAQYGSPVPTTQVGSPPTVQYGSPQVVTYASPGSYSTPPYGSPAPPMHPAPQVQTSVQPQVPVATTVPALPQIERLNLNNVPMYRPAPAQNLNQPSDMAEVWHREFANKFSKFSHQWELVPVPPQNEDRADGIFEDTAKIRFVCKNCRNGWTSMQGKVKFWYILDQTTQKGKIHFNLFGQKCKKCVSRGVHEIQDALWYPDEIAKVVYNIHCKVGMIYYNMYCPQIQIQRRIGHPKGQHNSDLCGACEKGICRRNNPNPFL